MNKRFLSVLLVLVLGAGLLSACSGGADNTASPTPSSATPTASPADLHGVVALTVGDVEVSVIEYNIYYFNTMYNLSQSYQNASLDPSGEDFDAAVSDQTDEIVQSTVFLAAEARKSGMTLSEDSQIYLDQTMASYDYYASSAGVSADDFISQTMGAGATRADYEKYLGDGLLASQWLKAKADACAYSRSDYTAYYYQHRDDVDTVDFRFYMIQPENLGEDATDAEKTAARDTARAKAEAFSQKAVSEDAFIAAAVEFADEADKETFQNKPDTTLVWHTRISKLGDQKGYFFWIDGEQRVWLADPVRLMGDRTVAEWNGGQMYIVFCFLGRQRPDYHAANVRHILFTFKGDDDTNTQTPTDTQKADAQQQAQDAYDQWKAGELTEASFATLAGQLSEDTGSNTNGGLYENVRMGELERPFEEWCFEVGRRPGDSGLVETVFGFHVMYYVSQNDQPAWMDIARDNLTTEVVNAYLDGLKASYPLVKNDSGMSLTKKQTS